MPAHGAHLPPDLHRGQGQRRHLRLLQVPRQADRPVRPSAPAGGQG
ncbi:hypothetical protein [Nocardioides convexus]|nr:hypothetical protein [Nocardioides convexus]